MDMNTPPEDKKLRAPAAVREIPTRAECEAILARQSVRPAIIRHARIVAEVAQRISRALAQSGVPLNLELVLAGALLHDLAKGEPEHASAGALLLRSMNLPQVAAVVAMHTGLDCFDGRLDERAIVYLADKLVRGERKVTIAQKFQPALARSSNDPAARHAAQSRMATAQAIALAVETRLGEGLDQAVGSHGESLFPACDPRPARGLR
jgi:putative nucleotidyltransferase with HDIG domain